jgi:DNA-binding NarL/FixJ family response regulator
MSSLTERAPETPLRVVIADDHPFYRRGLVRSLRASGIDVVAEAPNGEAAIRAVEETAPDVVVMDLKMPGLSGLEATRRLKDRRPGSRVLMLSVSAEEADVTNAMMAGANGYVLKDRPVEEVIAGIEAAATGEILISPAIASLLVRRSRAPADIGLESAYVRFTDPELEVLDLLAEGYADDEIAAALWISPATVRARATSILTKLVRAAAQVYRSPRQ